jgi:hypothetical protein
MNTGAVVPTFHFIFMVKGEVMLVKGHAGAQGEWIYRFIHSFIFWALDWERFSKQRLGLFDPRKNPGTHHAEECLGPMCSIDGCGE